MSNFGNLLLSAPSVKDPWASLIEGGGKWPLTEKAMETGKLIQTDVTKQYPNHGDIHNLALSNLIGINVGNRVGQNNLTPEQNDQIKTYLAANPALAWANKLPK